MSTRATEHIDKDDVKKENKNLIEQIAEYQKIMYAQEKYSLLIILQGVDAAGKDGTIKRIFKGINPLGCKVKGFKKPTEDEFAHDFLWRVHEHAPAKGMIQIFNRSHYEDILVPSVEGYFTKKIIDERYELINNFEKLLQHNGTTVLKFYLHISKEEQHERLIERIENREKHWKHNDGDWDSRAKWDAYMEVYERIFKECNEVPWHIVPADQNWNKVNIVCKKTIEAFEQMNLAWPELDSDRF